MSARLALAVAVACASACDNASWQPGANCGHAGTACVENGDCCSFACNGTCECAPIGEHCLADVACCSGSVCENEACIAGCRDNDHFCEQDDDCCSRYCNNGTCADKTTCRDYDAACDTTSQCCPGLECSSGGRCLTVSCQTPGQACSTGMLCCSGAICNPSGVCEACSGSSCCVGEGAVCGQTACCAPYTCNFSDHCATCGGLGAPCMGYQDCCSPRGCTNKNTCAALAGEPCATVDDCNSFGGRSECLQSKCCVQNNGNCTTGSECCSGICNGTICAPTPDGGACNSVLECASFPNADCLNNACCRLQNQPCTVSTDCCGGTCRNNKTCN